MLVFLSSLAVFLASIILAGAVKSLPLAELKRQARADNKGKTTSIYKLVSYGRSLDIFLGLLVISSFIGSILAAAAISWWLVVVVFILSLIVWLKDPNGRSGKVHWSLAGYLAYPADWLLRIMDPLFRRLRMVSSPAPSRRHTRAYVREDLLELIERQGAQADNRISPADLQIVQSALTFDDQTVSSIMVPRRKIKLIEASESIGPHLMDELHASGYTSFPVTSGSPKVANPEIVGVLYLHDAVDLSARGKVEDIMQKGAYFVAETQTLREALSAVLKTRSHLLMVVNNFEEIIGTISLEQIAKRIFGELPPDEFEHWDKPHAVAGHESKSSKTGPKSVVK